MAEGDRKFQRFTQATSQEALTKFNNMADGLEEHEKEIQRLKSYVPYTIFVCSDDLPAAIHVLGLKKGVED